jgi:aminocarboxymuconate-semialdehyde decarboxylase
MTAVWRWRRWFFSGLFDRRPSLRIITHHMGAMIPYFAGRIVQGWGLEMGSRTPPADADLLPRPLKRPAEDYFKMFLADTALSVAVGATRCGLDYFGAKDTLELAQSVRQKIDFENMTCIIRECRM